MMSPLAASPTTKMEVLSRHSRLRTQSNAKSSGDLLISLNNAIDRKDSFNARSPVSSRPSVNAAPIDRRVTALNARSKFASNPGPMRDNSFGGSTNLVKERKLYECGVCHQFITSGGSAFGGKTYHSHCFVCSETTCGKNLTGVLVFERDDALFCEKDYHKRYSPPCHYCKEPIKENAIEAVNKFFHADHFFCSQCGKTFGRDDLFMQYDGKAYCEDDYASLFAGRCAGCHLFLTTEYITALDKTWHNECFVCSVSPQARR
jgi:hypothetical protein